MSSKHLDITVDSLTRADYGTYYGIYIDLIPKGMSLATALDHHNAPLIDLASGLTEEQALHRYAPDKWSIKEVIMHLIDCCLLYTSPSPRDQRGSRMPSSA